MTTTAYPLPIHRGCGHTTQQHHTLDGLEADLRNAERVVRQLTADLVEAAKDRDRYRDLLAVALTENDRHRAELGRAQELIAELRNNRERDDRALARYDTRQEQAADLGSPAARAQDQEAQP